MEAEIHCSYLHALCMYAMDGIYLAYGSFVEAPLSILWGILYFQASCLALRSACRYSGVEARK